MLMNKFQFARINKIIIDIGSIAEKQINHKIKHSRRHTSDRLPACTPSVLNLHRSNDKR